MQTPLRRLSTSWLSDERSTLLLPSAEENPTLAHGLSIRDTSNIERSTLILPRQVQTLHESTLREPKGTLVEYDEVTLVQYISDSRLRDKIRITLPIPLQHWPVTGRGRIFTVKRFPTSWGEDMAFDNIDAPAAALKCLTSSAHGGSEERSLRYRCLLQELRILLHDPFKKHFNFSRIEELGWESDPLLPQSFLPYLFTEYATFGTIQNFLISVHAEYRWKQRLILDVAEGISALHKCSIVHSDVKMENVLIFPCQDPNFPIVAKLSDFGFSLELDRCGEAIKLIGCTPLWAAPEALRGPLPVGSIKLIDIYSFGFIIWGIAIGGKSPFEELEFLSASSMAEDWTSWKESNELVSMAVSRMYLTEPHANTNVDEICHLISSTMQLNPMDRNIDNVLRCLHGKCDRALENETARCSDYRPLEPFDHDKVKQLSAF
jgi:serine/threonine protein kinase